ncbi:MAG: molecular chaperone [Sideroxydans sp.]|nr:molecular chaperone TorD family protein [Sideroxyarcus sp.]
MLQDITNTEADFSNGELVAECNARANIYRLLAGVFLEEPSTDYLNALRSPEVLSSLRAMGAIFSTDFTSAPLAQLQETLACEYAVLFVVAGGCPPVESVRLTGRYQQQPFFEVRDFYKKNGFGLSAGRFAVFEDQLGVELTFMAEMLERAAMKLDSGDQVAYTRLLKEIKRFWALHLGKWVRGYASLLERASEHSFYRQMARLLGAFAEWELELLGVRVDDLDGGKLKVPKAKIEYEFDPDEPVCDACDKGRNDGDDLEALLQTIDISLIEKRVQGKS